MNWKKFNDNLKGLEIQGLGYFAPTNMIRINNLPTDAYITVSRSDGHLWISAIGLAWSSEEKYLANLLEGITHYTFAPKIQKLNGNQQMLFRTTGGAQVPKNQAIALIDAGVDFSSFRPSYRELVRKSIVSIVESIVI